MRYRLDRHWYDHWYHNPPTGYRSLITTIVVEVWDGRECTSTERMTYRAIHLAWVYVPGQRTWSAYLVAGSVTLLIRQVHWPTSQLPAWTMQLVDLEWRTPAPVSLRSWIRYPPPW